MTTIVSFCQSSSSEQLFNKGVGISAMTTIDGELFVSVTFDYFLNRKNFYVGPTVSIRPSGDGFRWIGFIGGIIDEFRGKIGRATPSDMEIDDSG